MTEDEILRERLQSALDMLEIADMEAVRAKRQLRLIFDLDAPTGTDIALLPCRFEIDGHVYRALLTPQQRDFIVLTAHDHTVRELLDKILDQLFEKQLYAAAANAEQALIAALKNELVHAPPVAFGYPMRPNGEQNEPIGPGVRVQAGACRFSNGDCREPFGKSLCLSQGGSFATACNLAPPPKPVEDPLGVLER